LDQEDLDEGLGIQRVLDGVEIQRGLDAESGGVWHPEGNIQRVLDQEVLDEGLGIQRVLDQEGLDEGVEIQEVLDQDPLDEGCLVLTFCNLGFYFTFSIV
jgi:hypothetical protein